jgi:hypothetical protein
LRQILIDELDNSDVTKLLSWLTENAEPAGLDGLFWITLTNDLLDPDQHEATHEQPFCFAIEVGESWTKLEFLIRSRQTMRSHNTRYASPMQQKFILDFCNRLVGELKLRT